MTSSRPQGELTVERMCVLARVNRAGYYRRWQASAPRQEETAARDAIQRVVLANRRYGYRRVAAQLRRDGFVANHKRVLRLMRQDNRIPPAWAAGCLFVAVPALEQRGVFFMDFDEIDEVLDSEVGEGHHAVLADAVDPYHAVFDIHFVGDVG
jgi:hypothetical protein